jgi:hypothetical protein
VALIPAAEDAADTAGSLSTLDSRRSYAGLTAAELIDRVVQCRQACRCEDRSLRVILDELRRAYGHHAYPFAASLERLAFGTHGPALFQESMEPAEVKIVNAILERLTGSPPADDDGFPDQA